MSLEEWAEALATTVLVGTARRGLPEPPDAAPLPAGLGAPRPGTPPEAILLDAVAVTSALRRAGTPPARGDGPDAAPDDVRPPPPPRARQLLDLLLSQPPGGSRLAPYALLTWLRTAEAHGVRVHHPALVPLLARATRTHDLRPAVVPVLDARGRWLAGLDPAWSWATNEGDPARGSATDDPVDLDPRAWAHLSTVDRAVAVRRRRDQDPHGARALVASSWSSDPAPARAELLGALEVGLSPDDEDLLEQALDDRAAGVRDTAVRLLDALPASARARRLGRLLAPLLSTSGLVRRRVTVQLPPTPDPVAVRDGLGRAPRGRSERGHQLQRLAAGSPFATWTDTTGLDPATVVRTLEDDDALAGLRAAAVGRRDVTWARALLDRAWDPVLAGLLPEDEVLDRMLGRVQQVRTVPDLTSAVRISTSPWDEAVSTRVVGRLARLERPPHVLGELVVVLADRLHPAAAPAVARLVPAGAGPGDPLHQLAQHLSLVPTLTEAFA